MDNVQKNTRQSKLAKAEKLLQAQLDANPDDVRAILQLANVYLEKGNNKKALEYADKAKKIDDCDPSLSYIRGKILRLMGDFTQSISEWDFLLTQDENDMIKKGYSHRSVQSMVNDARYYKADCLYHLYRDKEALVLIEQHIKHRAPGIRSDFSKKDAILFYKVLKYSKIKSPKSISEEGIASDTQRIHITQRIEALEQSNNPDRLIRYLKSVCIKFPGEYFPKILLSEYCGRYKYKIDSLNYAQSAFEDAPDDPLAIYTYGEALMLNNNQDKAVAIFQKLLNLGIDYIAYSEHGEGMRWAKSLVRKTERNILSIKRNSQQE